MPRIERNFEQTIKNLKRDVVELKRTSQASLVGYVDKETGKIKDTLEDLNVDVRSPAAPVEVVADFYVHESYNGKRREGYITIASAPVTKATDGSDIQVSKYEMWARSAVYESGSEPPFELQSSATDPSLRSLPVEQYKPYEVVIRAVTPTGRPGLFSEVKTVTVTDDDTPPPMPSQLTLTQGLGVVDMTWDGLSFGETLMPLDFWRTEIGVRYGGASDYTVITEWFEEAGIRYYTGAPVNELLYISHRSYDYAGNVSGWTEPATITVTPVVDEESIRLRLEEVQDTIDQVGEELRQTHIQLTQELSDANDRLDQNDQLMDQLVNTDLPALNQELDANTGIINNLNDVVLPDLNTRLSDTEDDLAQSKVELDGRLDQAETDIGNAESNLTNLSTVTIPALNTRLDNAQAEIDTNQTELTNRLDDAFLDIGTAQSRADAAYTMAGSKNAVYYSSSEPSGDGTSAGDLWRQRNSSREVIGEWQWTGSAWEKQTVSGSNVSNMDIGYLTAGAADISDAVIDKLWADVITARKINASQINVGEFGNLATIDEVRGVNVTFPSTYETMITDGYVASAPASQNYIMFKDQTTTVPFVANDKLRVSFYAKTVGTADIWSFVRLWTYNNVAEDVNSNGPSYTAEYFYVKPTEQFFSMTLTIGNNLTREQQSWIIGLGKSPDVKDIRVRNVRVYRMTGSDLLVNGAVSANHINADSVAGAVAEFINLDVSQLTASSASISNAVTDKLWADVITARKITTGMLAIGSFDNIIPDPTFTNDGGSWSPMNTVYSIDPTGGQGGTTALKITRNTASQLGKYTEWMPSMPGATYRMIAWVKADGSIPVGAISLYARVQRKSNGLVSSANVGSNAEVIPANTWAKIETTYSVLDDSKTMAFGIYSQATLPAGVDVWVDSFSATRMSSGELIVTGSITGEHLEVNSVATKVATVIKLNANTITSGTINTARLNTSAIAAATASIQKADVANLTASSATISQAVINKLWADVIHARKITAEMLSIGDFDSFAPSVATDPGAYTYRGEAFDINWNLGYDGKGFQIRANPGGTVSDAYGPYRNVRPDDRIYVKCFARLYNDTAINMQVRVYWYNGDGSYLASSFVRSTAQLTGTQGWLEGVAVAPANAAQARVRLWGSGSELSDAVGWVSIHSLTARRMNGGELIVDGAILANHITASQSLSAKVGQFLEVTAGMIKANAVTAGSIAGGAIDGKVITGAIVRTSSSSSRVEMNSSGIHAWKSNVKTFQLLASTGEFEAVGSIQTGSDTSYRAKLSNRNGIAALDIYGAGGASAPHLAAIYSNNQSIIRNYMNESSYSGGMAITNTWTRLDQENGSAITLYKDNASLVSGVGSHLSFNATSAALSHHNGGQLYMDNTRTQLTTDTGNMLDMDSDGIRLVSGPGGTVFDEVVLSGTRTLRLPQVTTATTSGSANVNVNNGYLREVASASRYKLNVAPIDESIDDRILSVEAVTWFDKSNAEILSEAMTPQSEGKKDVAIPSNAEKRIPGVIAEQVLESGLDEFVIFGDDGEVQSVMYDRMGVALIPVVKRLRERVVSLEGNLSDAIGRLDAAGL